MYSQSFPPETPLYFKDLELVSAKTTGGVIYVILA
jgi:hypothetical protein